MYLGEGISKCAILASLNLNLKNNRMFDIGLQVLVKGIVKCATLTSLNLKIFGILFFRNSRK